MAEKQGSWYEAPEHFGKCGNCRFWAQPSRNGTGSCRRHPPAPSTPRSTLWALSQLVWFAAGEALTNADKNFDPEAQSSIDIDGTNFPPTDEDDWCGEFAALVGEA